MAITIRPPANLKEYRIIDELQAEIWGTTIGVTPGIFLYVIAKEGGVVLLALDDDKPVGFSFAFPGLAANNRVKLASHQTGILPAYRDQGVGYRLKLAQREAALAKNLDHITWTFDPLQSRNARLNLRKLGAVCNTYLPNFYGDMPDELNQGLPSDRFHIDWWVATKHVARRVADQDPEPQNWRNYPILNAATFSAQGLPLPPASFDAPDGRFCLVEIPDDFPALKEQSLDLALQWRRHTREIFKAAFAAGYTAIDLLRRQGQNFYLLQKDWPPVEINKS